MEKIGQIDRGGNYRHEGPHRRSPVSLGEVVCLTSGVALSHGSRKSRHSQCVWLEMLTALLLPEVLRLGSFKTINKAAMRVAPAVFRLTRQPAYPTARIVIEDLFAYHSLAAGNTRARPPTPAVFYPGW